jgi:hypothetical protein
MAGQKGSGRPSPLEGAIVTGERGSLLEVTGSGTPEGARRAGRGSTRPESASPLVTGREAGKAWQEQAIDRGEDDAPSVALLEVTSAEASGAKRRCSRTV